MIRIRAGITTALIAVTMAAPIGPASAATAVASRIIAAPAANLSIARIRGVNGDLPGFRVVNKSSGATFAVYYEPTAEALAQHKLLYLSEIIEQVAHGSLADPGAVNWASVIFTSDPNYAPPRGGAEVRWVMEVDSQGNLTKEGEKSLFTTLPHEQVHAVQHSLAGQLPRWYAEGQASWLGLQVASTHRPDLAKTEQDRIMTALSAAGHGLKLPAWGGLKIKREAIYRQVSKEEQHHMDVDPSFVPLGGAFKFLPDDFVSDESDTAARYGAAMSLFASLEARTGRAAVNAWMKAIWAEPTTPNSQRIAELAKQITGLDISDALK